MLSYITRKNAFALAATLTFLPLGVEAAVQQVNFTMSGSLGETATGWITYDDSVVPDGGAVGGGGICGGGPDNSIDYKIMISGGQVGPVTFNKADCSSPPAFCNAPDFQVDVNFFSCSADGATGNGISVNTFSVTNNSNTSSLAFQSISQPIPVRPAAPVPVLGPLGLLLLSAGAGLLGLMGLRRRK